MSKLRSKCLKKCRAIGEYIHTVFIQIFVWKVTTLFNKYSYLSKEQSGAQKLQSGGAPQVLLSGENSDNNVTDLA